MMRALEHKADILCRLFTDTQAFERERAEYSDPLLRSVLPTLHEASDNTDGAARSATGALFPPYMVLERGMPLADWMRQPRGHLEVAVMVQALAALLARLHGAQRVHRDVKPDNALYMLQTTQWRLLDMGIAAPAGALLCATPMHSNMPVWRF